MEFISVSGILPKRLITSVCPAPDYRDPAVPVWVPYIQTEMRFPATVLVYVFIWIGVHNTVIRAHKTTIVFIVNDYGRRENGQEIFFSSNFFPLP